MTESPTVPAFPTTRAPGCPFEPPAEFAKMREEAITQASCPAGMDAWVVSRYEDVRAVLSAPGVSSRGAPSTHMIPDTDFDRPNEPGNLIQLDGKEHARLRRMLTPEFTVRRMEALRPYIQRIIDEHIDALLAGPRPADLYQDFALPIPSLVICELLGVPYEDREKIHAHSTNLVGLDEDARWTAYIELQAYMAALFDSKLATPADDLIGRMIVRGRESGDPITTDEMIGLCVLLLVAGHETTTTRIVLNTAALLQHPDKLAELRHNPDLAPAAVEEMLRYISAGHGLLRYASEDIQVGEQTITAGEWVVAATGPGNRDESVYDHADVIDFHRGSKTHLSFGFGVHQCIGQQLARIELQEVSARLFRRIPTLRLAIPFDQLAFKPNAIVYGVQELPITWGD